MTQPDFLNQLTEQFSSITSRPSLDYTAINISPTELIALCSYLKNKKQFAYLMDLTAVDWGDNSSPRFSTVYHLYSTTQHTYLRIVCDCSDDNHPSMPSLTELWPAANWHEREAFDMFGIDFKGHPDLRRILMWDEYPHHPLRKDFPLAGIETSIASEEIQEETDATVIAAPMAGGPFCSSSKGFMSRNEPKGADQAWSEQSPKPNN